MANFTLPLKRMLRKAARATVPKVKRVKAAIARLRYRTWFNLQQALPTVPTPDLVSSDARRVELMLQPLLPPEVHEVGLAPHKRAQLFDEWTRADAEIKRRLSLHVAAPERLALADSYAFWTHFEGDWPMVASLALHALTAPLLTACVERVMSFVRAMAHDDRFSMKEKSFELELFLRANRALVYYLENLALERLVRRKKARTAAAAAGGGAPS